MPYLRDFAGASDQNVDISARSGSNSNGQHFPSTAKIRSHRSIRYSGMTEKTSRGVSGPNRLFNRTAKKGINDINTSKIDDRLSNRLLDPYVF